MRAQDEYAAVQKIRETCPVILEIREVKEKDGSFLSMDIGGKSKINSQQLSVLCSQFAVMLKSGMPVSKTIEMVARQTENKGIRKMLLNISEDVSGGSTVAGENISPVSLGIHQQFFLSDLYQRIANRSIAMWVKLHGVSYDICHLVVATVVHSLHRVKDAALHRL